MAEKWGGIINYAIGIMLLVAALFIFRKKAVENPGKKFSGVSIQTIYKIIYVVIAIDVFLMVMELVK